MSSKEIPMDTREIDKPPFNDRYTIVKISPEEEEIGGKIHKLFRTELRRVHPWTINRHGVVTIVKNGREIGGIENENISPELARVLDGFNMVERFLPDFIGQGNQFVRSNMGLFEFHTQWAGEESLHGQILEILLEQTGHKPEEEVIKEYHENLTRVWEPPFRTTRQIVAHAAFQERGTEVGYEALAIRAIEEGAPKTAEILRLIGSDESFHGKGYTKVTRIFYETDPEGTIDDVLYVASEFRMPAENLHPDREQWVRDLVGVGALSKELLREGVIYRTLKAFDFIPESVARKTADGFLKRRKTGSKVATA